MFPPLFVRMTEDLLGNESSDLLNALDQPPEISVRINIRKPGANFSAVEPVTWCKSGFYLSKRPDFIFDPFLHAGAYYVQEASSMIYETVASYLVEQLKSISPSANLKVLDMCAAPGGKTTAMINALQDNDSIIANEYSPKRVEALRENITKWGFKGASVTNNGSAFLGSQSPSFDIIAVDAPCSGEGMMRKDPFARTQWSPDLVRQCSALQREILTNAVKALKPGGFLIYSTCTFNRMENEENVEFAVNELSLQPVDPSFPQIWGIPTGISTNLPVFRFMPHKTRGEGLFLAILHKPGAWQPSFFNSKSTLKPILKKTLPPSQNKDEIPPIEEILSVNNSLSHIPHVELDKESALAYLRRESIFPPAGTPRGIIILTYHGLSLGAGKNIGSRINNLYPKSWRILKR